MTQRPAPWPYGSPYTPYQDPDHDPRAFVAPLVATVLAGPVIALCAVLVLISPMMTDSCTRDGCRPLYVALLVAPVLLVLATGSLIASWAIPWRRRHRTKRVVAALAAPLLALATALVYVNLPAAS